MFLPDDLTGWVKWLASAAPGTWLVLQGRAEYDRRKVQSWLLANTADESGKSHVGTIRIAKGTRLTEERVHRACMSNPDIHGPWSDRDSPEAWSVWRAEPQRPGPKLFILESKTGPRRFR